MLGIFLIQDYLAAHERVEQVLTGMQEMNKEIPDKPQEDSEPVRVMDSVVYTVLLDDNNDSIDVINHSQKDITSSEIESLAKKYIKEDGRPKAIGNLFVDDYAYRYEKNNSVVIVDLENVRSSLLVQLRNMLLLFVGFLLLSVILSRQLTVWLVKPVEEAFEKQKTFIADASHELKTPLAIIMASNDALKSKNPNSSYTSNIEQEALRMNDLIKHLLDMAELEEQRLVLTDVNLSQLVELTALTYESMMFEQGFTLETEIEDSLHFSCDEDKIKQVLMILMDNAMKYGQKGTPIRITLHQKKHNIVLCVQNQGETIPLDKQEKIFDRFYKADASRNRDDQHYGLGLAIAKSIVEKHHGSISLESKDHTTTFTIVLTS